MILPLASSDMDYDTTEIPSAYDKGRDHGPQLLDLWMDAVASRIEKASIHTILDLGCGTGRFSEALAARFNAEVIGIDPSKKMLEQAKRKQLDSRVRYELGSGESIPLPDNSVDLIFMSMIFHHFADPALAARECRRVLREGKKAVLRTGTREHISAYAYVDFFPESRPILNEVLPGSSMICDVFEAAGFRVVTIEAITQTIAPNHAVYAEKLASGADSVLARLSQTEFENGLSALHTHASRVAAEPVVEPIDFFVFETRRLN
jgi:ubiquinone/menaquinone biosynthesis C-methylase UbiE